MIDVNELKFDKDGLIPAVVVDSITKKVLTVAYMNKESLEISMEKGLTCFFSRSRQKLWLKGETSGNYQHIVSITADCDNDALVVVVEPDGPACHKGTFSCFHNPVFESEEQKKDYIKQVKASVNNKFKMSAQILEKDYYGYIFKGKGK
mgnify:CR=1 FL=1